MLTTEADDRKPAEKMRALVRACTTPQLQAIDRQLRARPADDAVNLSRAIVLAELKRRGLDVRVA